MMDTWEWILVFKGIKTSTTVVPIERTAETSSRIFGQLSKLPNSLVVDVVSN